MQLMKEANVKQREKLTRLREKYVVLLDAYNELVEEAKDRSDSSSSSKREAEGEVNQVER